MEMNDYILSSVQRHADYERLLRLNSYIMAGTIIESDHSPFRANTEHKLASELFWLILKIH